MKHILIIGTDRKWEENELVKAASSKLTIKVLNSKLIDIHLNITATELFYEGKNITREFKNSNIIFRRTRGGYEKIIALALLAENLGIPFTDSVISIMSNLNKMISMPSISTRNIKQIPTVFWDKKESFNYKSITFSLPLLVKPIYGRHGKGIQILKNLGETKKFFMKNRSIVLIQPFLAIEEEYRVLVVGNKSLGSVKKIPAQGLNIANYAAGAQFIPAKIPKVIEKEAIEICKQEGIDIGGVDLAKVNNKYYLLEVNRCPEFRAFSKATNINVAEKIINFVHSMK